MSDPRRELFRVACTGMVVFGMILALPGTVIGLPEVTTLFHLTLADRGVFIGALFSGLLIGSLASGPLVDRAGFRAAIVGSAAAIASLLPVFALATSYRVAVLALAGVGASSATLNIAANALSSELFPAERGRRMTLLALAFSAGGLLLPAATATAAGVIPWRGIVLGGAAVSAVVAIMAMRLPSMPAYPDAPSSAGVVQALRQPGFPSFCVLLACGAANESTFAGWTSSFLTESGVSPAVATWGLSSHWFGLLVGRMAFAGRVDRAKPASIVRAAMAGSVILLLMILIPSVPVLALGPFAGGIAIGVIVPTSLALAGERYPGNAGTLFALLLTMAQLGSMIVPPVIGAVADVVSLRMALLIAVVNGWAIAWLARRVDAGAH